MIISNKCKVFPLPSVGWLACSICHTIVVLTCLDCHSWICGFCSTYGFILTVPDLSPNIGVLWWVLSDMCCIWTEKWFCIRFKALHLWTHMYDFWIRYFFAEVFDFFRNFFLIVFHVNILFMILPLAIRLNHRPCFLAFVYIAISSLLKSYPSVSSSIFDKYLVSPVF